MKPLSESNYGHPGNEGPQHGVIHQVNNPDKQPYWKRAHRDWVFVLGMVLVFLAIGTYVFSDDLSLLPRGQPHVTLPGTIGK
jgi:hypothetical protein